jgi:dTDP-4-dehydrorhamnose reductase
VLLSRILVTGARGMLGAAVVRAAESGGHDVVARTREQLDVTDLASVRAALEASRPQVVVNCAAYTDVDGAESDEATALAVNGAGPGNVARAAADIGARVVHVSTDYVFDGSSSRPYVEADEPAPRSAYGRTKLAGEGAVLAASGRNVVARTSWLFGAGGRNFVDTMLALGTERDVVEVVTDQVGCPTWSGHLADALVSLAGRDDAAGLYHVAGAGECSWHDLAVEVFAQAGVDCRVEPTDSTAMQRPAPRPAYSVLVSAREDAPKLPAWQEGVSGHLAERGLVESRLDVRTAP